MTTNSNEGEIRSALAPATPPPSQRRFSLVSTQQVNVSHERNHLFSPGAGINRNLFAGSEETGGEGFRRAERSPQFLEGLSSVSPDEEQPGIAGLGCSGLIFVNELDAARGDTRVKRSETISVFLNLFDLYKTDPSLVDLFVAQGRPRRVNMMIDAMNSKFDWYKNLRKKLVEELKTQKGSKLRDSITSFMKDFQSRAHGASAFLTASVAINDLLLYDTVTHKGTQLARITQRASAFWLQYLSCPQDKMEASFLAWTEGKDAPVDLHASSSILRAPGLSRIDPTVVGSVSALTRAVHAMLRFIARDSIRTVVPESEVLAKIDKFLIRRSEDHSMIMKNGDVVEDWLADHDEKLEDLVETAYLSRHPELIPNQAELRANLVAAISPGIWSILLEQAVKLEVNFAELPYDAMRSWMLDAQDILELRNVNRNGRLKNYGSHKVPTTVQGSGTTPTDAEEASEGKKSKKKKKKKKSEADGSEAEDPIASSAAPSKTPSSSTTTGEGITDEKRKEYRARTPCWNFSSEGGCSRGAECQFMHDPSVPGSKPASGTKPKTNHEISTVATEPLNESAQGPAGPEEDDDFELETAVDGDEYNSRIKTAYAIKTSRIEFIASVKTRQAGPGKQWDRNRYEALIGVDQDSDDSISSDEDSLPSDHDEWCRRIRSRQEPNSEIARLTRSDPRYGGQTAPSEFLDRKQRAARNRPLVDHLETPYAIVQDGAKEMLLSDVPPTELKAGIQDSDLDTEDSIDLSSVSQEESKLAVAVSGQRLLTDWFQKRSSPVATLLHSEVIGSATTHQRTAGSPSFADGMDSPDSDLAPAKNEPGGPPRSLTGLADCMADQPSRLCTSGSGSVGYQPSGLRDFRIPASVPAGPVHLVQWGVGHLLPPGSWDRRHERDPYPEPEFEVRWGSGRSNGLNQCEASSPPCIKSVATGFVADDDTANVDHPHPHPNRTECDPDFR